MAVRHRFGLALFVIILLIIASITLSLLLRGKDNPDTHRADLERGAIQRLEPEANIRPGGVSQGTSRRS
jgi:hypothetical protein